MISCVGVIRRSALACAIAACVVASACSGSSSTLLANSPSHDSYRHSSGPGKGIIPDTWVDIHPFQVFDGDVPPDQAQQDAYRYDAVWGSREPTAWRAGNQRIVTGFYAPFDGDFDPQETLSWWKANHPSWVLYKCDHQTPAYPSGLSNVPLDISNPAVVAWEMQTYGPAIEAAGYTGLTADLVGLNNADGGCGVFVKGVWQQRFTGQSKDDAWSQAVLAWFRYTFAYMHSLPRPLIVGANHVPENRPLGDPEEIDLINHIDLIADESAFTDYGNGYTNSGTVALIIGWMKYVQGIGKPYVILDKWDTANLTDQQLGWSIATYLLGKYHSSALFTDHLPGYGYEYWYPQYLTHVGAPCADAYVANNDTGLYFRKYSAALIVANTTSGQTYTVPLPNSSYVDIFGVTISSPMTIGPDTADVLLTTSGCK
jgi:hypothetical protein